MPKVYRAIAYKLRCQARDARPPTNLFENLINYLLRIRKLLAVFHAPSESSAKAAITYDAFQPCPCCVVVKHICGARWNAREVLDRIADR